MAADRRGRRTPASGGAALREPRVQGCGPPRTATIAREDLHHRALPEPFSPTGPTISPGTSCRLAPCNTGVCRERGQAVRRYVVYTPSADSTASPLDERAAG